MISKKKILFATAILISSISFCQTIFSEDFDGSQLLPLNWTVYNVDNNTPATPVNNITEAWTILENSESGTGNHIVSTSWYSPAGTSNDWIVTPSITIPATGYFLEFDVMAKDISFPDQFSVYINTVGNQVANFTMPALILDSIPSNSYSRKSIDLSAYSGQTIYIAIVNSSFDKYLLFVDNIIVRIPTQNDAILTNATLNRFSMINMDNNLELTVKNDGTNPITSVTVNWNDGTASHSSEITCSIIGGGSTTIIHPIAVNYEVAAEKTITTTITSVNTLIDPTPINNLFNNKINTVGEIVQKNTLFEVGTSTECGTCVEGIVRLNEGYSNHPTNLIGINVHHNDVMTDLEYDSEVNLVNELIVNVDRQDLNIATSSTSFENYYEKHSAMIAPASVEGEISMNGSEVQIIVKANFKTPFAAANYRLGAIMSENNVVGTGPTFDQTNDYAGGTIGLMEGYELLTNPIPTSNMVYQYVGRTLLGGYNGQIGSVPTTITEGQSCQFAFSYTVPSTSVRSNMNVTFVLIDQVTGAIVNAKQMSLSLATIQEFDTSNQFKLYPNPVSENLAIVFEATKKDYTITINDLAGKTVLTKQFSNLSGAQEIAIPVENIVSGSYLVTIASEGSSYSQQIIIK